jgi:hypothetical protein
MTHTRWIVLACLFGSATAAPQPQNPAEDVTLQDSSTTKSEKPERPTSLQLLVPNILHDQKPNWTFPLRVAEGKHWKPLFVITLATVGLESGSRHRLVKEIRSTDDTSYYARSA